MPTLTDADIGKVIARHGDRRGKYHLIESIVAFRAVTNCGKKMKPFDGEGNELVVMNGEPTCQLCKP